MQTLKILMLGASKRLSLARLLKRSANVLGFHADLFSYETSKLGAISSEATTIIGRDFRDPRVLNEVQDVILDKRIDLCLAFNDKALPLMPAIGEITFAPACSEDLIRIFGSKSQTKVFMDKLGVPTIENTHEVPCIVKPDNGSASSGVRRFLVQSELDEFLALNEGRSFITQKYLSGPEFSLDCYRAVNSEITLALPRERVIVSGGEVTVSNVVQSDELVSLTSKILSLDGVYGPLNIQFMWDADRSVHALMEVNARFGGGASMTEIAGIPWTEILLRDLLRFPQAKEFNVRDGYIARAFEDVLISPDDEQATWSPVKSIH